MPIVKMTAEYLPRRNQPDKSIVVMDGACAWHVMKKGRGGELSLDDVRYMVSIEAKLSKDAL
jgi:ATP-dependent Clp protease ATP-binding subunit ClpA